jgi:hypothetical protein
MYNKEVLEELVKKFGIDNTILFFKMEALKNAILYEGCIKNNENTTDCVEFDFERDWWQNKYEELNKTKSL